MKCLKKINVHSVQALLLCLLMQPAFIESAQAYSDRDVIQLNVTGNIIDGTCNVTKPESIDLGKYYWKDFAVAGGNTANVPVTIAFEGCTAGLTQANVNFSGSPYSEDPAYGTVIYANQISPDAGGTTDVGLQLFIRDADHPISGIALANGTNYPVEIDENHSGSMTFNSRMYTPHGTPTPGAFSSVITLNVTYN
ncbi:fimbrial protein [Enterobacteriaceae bacterium H16N7]|nr:fimbrial protein [Dryocola clanedunensis]